MQSKTMPLLLTCLAFSIQTMSFAQEQEERMETVVFSTDTIDGVSYIYRIPALITSVKGTLLAFAERRRNQEDHAQNDIVLKRSFDNGKNWAGLQVIADFDKNSLNDPLAVSLSSGRILLFFAEFPAGIHTRNFVDTQIADNGYDGPRNSRSYMMYSDDDGASWSTPGEITRSIRPSDRISVGHPGIAIQLVRGLYPGRIVLPLYLTKKNDDEGTIWTNAVAWSDDNGHSWQMSPDIPQKGHVGYGNEAQIVERTDSSLLYIARNQGGVHRKTAISRDGGANWTNMRLDFELPGVATQGSVLRYSWPDEGENLILFSSPADKYSRKQGTIRLSTNDGERWSFSKTISPDFFGYSCLTKLKNNHIGLLYESNAYNQLVYTSFTIDWIKAGDSIRPKDPYLSIPIVDLDKDSHRQVVVDKEKDQYLGPPTTLLLADGKTILAVYPKGDTIGGLLYKKSVDAGASWGKRLPVPVSWADSIAGPTLFRMTDKYKKERLILWSGAYPARFAVSEDNGLSWSDFEKAGNWGGIGVMSSMIALETGRAHYMALFHDDQRFFTAKGSELYAKDREEYNSRMFSLYKTYSDDGGLTWSFPEVVNQSREMQMSEPCIIRSPDGTQLAVIFRDDSRRENSMVIFSENEGKNWTRSHALPNELTGDRHVARFAPDGRLLILFRDRSAHFYGDSLVTPAREAKVENLSLIAEKTGLGSPTEGDWVAWVGTYEDLAGAKEDKPGKGQYRIRLKDNTKGWEAGYSGLELLPDGNFVATSSGHWEMGEPAYILSLKFNLAELDLRLKTKK